MLCAFSHAPATHQRAGAVIRRLFSALAGAGLAALAVAGIQARGLWWLPGDSIVVQWVVAVVTMIAALSLAGLVFAPAVRRVLRTAHADAVGEAVAAERRRIAHDLHDSMAQDLTFIALYSERLAAAGGGEELVTLAARRALAASRGHIADLAASHAPTTADAIRAVGDEFSARYGVEVSVAAAGSADRAVAHDEASTPRRAAIVRIAREAIANAIRHGGARHVEVRVGSGAADEPLLRIADDGCGFGNAPLASEGSGLGLRAMSERASLLGAGVVAGAAAQGGAEIAVLSEP